MLTSKWRTRLHPDFGPIQVPIIDLEIETAGGEHVAFALCVDSGAVISLLPRFAAEMLGLDFDRGQAITLRGVGKQPTEARVHELRMRLAGLPDCVIPIAISTSENAPGLLGRMGVFDRFQIEFDARNRETRIRAV